MALPINIEDLLHKQRVESNRIEFKKGWNPSSIYRTICAFANDFDNLGGGYILIGVEEENGLAKRPVWGIPNEQLDKIQREIHQYNQLFEPFYAPRISVEDVDEKSVLVIWAPSGAERPYAVPAEVHAKNKKPTYYIRYGTSSIEAKGEFLEQLRDMANHVPFDDRGNENIFQKDLSPVLLMEYLQTVGSKLAHSDLTNRFEQVLDDMGLLEGPSEKRVVKNVAAMMFCNTPNKFFPVTQVDIVIFPEGREANPNHIIEVPSITGSVPTMIKNTLDYLKVNVIKEQIIKPKDREQSITYYNYPYQALEEAVVNALYHRDYREREPVEITIEPHQISILSYSGPDRSISNEAIKEAKLLRTRRYKNRRLGEFLKELGLTEGRATGIPTIQKTLKENGSNKATIETDEARSYFLIDIPCHPNFKQNQNRDGKLALQYSKLHHVLSKMCPRYV
ncbi:MAG: RNA-binding domain-containing protein, partial [Segatella oulorum]|uniref:RNA-binding domain-containing protein n=1 Tax=Segatella oulorum TaxID=28136 RepID=UPI003612204B